MHKSAKYLLAFVCILVLVAILIWTSQPSDGHVLQPNSAQSRLQNTLPTPSSEQTVSNECFTLSDVSLLSIPKHEKTSRGCVIRAALTTPRGQVTISQEAAQQATLALALTEHTGIRFRERDPETYILEPIQEIPSELKPYAVFSTPTEITGFFSHESSKSIITVSIHSVARVNPEVTDAFWEIVAAIVVE